MSMRHKLTATRVDEVPRTASVSDYDELDDDDQQTIQRLAAGETVDGSKVDREIVRFGEYYRLKHWGRHASD